MVILDTSVLIDFLVGNANPQSLWLGRQSNRRRIGITSLVLTEVMQGVRDDKIFAETLGILNEFEILETASRELSIASANNYRTLRKTGITILSTIDCLIATFCIEEGHTLLHNDGDFDAFETRLGLRVLHVPEP